MRISCGVVVVAVAALLGGCGGQGHAASNATQSEEFQPIRELTVTLDGDEGPENVGILMAKERGYFADVGISASIFGPIAPARPVSYVAHRVDDIGIAPEPQVVMARSKGAPIVAVGSVISQPTAAMIWLKKSGIKDIADLKGKTVAVPGLPFQTEFLQGILTRSGLKPGDVQIKYVGYELVPSLVSGRVDAIFGGSSNLQGAELEARGLKPIVTPVQNLGIPAYEEFMVVTRTDRVSKEPGLIRDFMSALARGTAAAIEDPRAALEAIEKAEIGGASVSRKALEAEIAATSPLLSEDGHMSPEQANGLVDWMYEEGMIQRKPSASSLLTNDFR